MTDRDLEIFSYLERFGAGSLGQIWAGFFKRVDRDTVPWLFLDKPAVARGVFTRVYKRLTKLVACGYLDRIQWVYPRHTLYRLTGKGHWQLVRKGLSAFAKPMEAWPKEGEFNHTLLLAAVALVLNRCLGRSIESEREIIRDYWKRSRKSGRYGQMRLADMVIKPIDDSGASIKVELELTLKNNSRYFDYWDYLGSDLRGVKAHILYIAGSPAIKDHILWLAKKKEARGLYACDLQAFKESLGNCHFVNMNGGVSLVSRFDPRAGKEKEVARATGGN
ncbi:MAG: hypothetical protein HY401_01575 [Elusimicrobia bacterium]|nr:hypothetical protein [Elusimicrobiota bacterium]